MGIDKKPSIFPWVACRAEDLRGGDAFVVDRAEVPPKRLELLEVAVGPLIEEGVLVVD